MKYEINFTQASEILAAAGKAEKKVELFFEADSLYKEISAIADDYFAEHDTYSMDLIDQRCDIREKRERACKAAFKAILSAIEMCEPSGSDYRYEAALNNARNTYRYNLRETLGYMKGIIREQMKYINY